MKQSQNLPLGGRRRKPLVEEESWVLLGDWYLGPGGTKEFKGWHWRAIIAHQCENGRIHSAGSFYMHKRKRDGHYTINGKCSGCGKGLSEELKFIIRITMLDL